MIPQFERFPMVLHQRWAISAHLLCPPPGGVAPQGEIPQVTSLLRMHIADPQGKCVVQVKMLVKMTTRFPRWPG